VPLAAAMLASCVTARRELQQSTVIFDPDSISSTMNNGDMLDMEAIANFGSPGDDNRTAKEIAAAAK